MAQPGQRHLSEQGSKLFRIRKTVLKMLAKRGYNVSGKSVDMTTDEFMDLFGDNPSREEMTILVEHSEAQEDQMFVFFPEDEKVGVKPIRTYGDRMREQGVSKCIIVVRGGMTPFARSATQELCSQRNVQVEDFKDAELMVDITEHVLVPEHIVLTPEAKAELLKRYKLIDTQLPRIQMTDPVARYYGLQRGQVVKIIRPSETAGRCARVQTLRVQGVLMFAVIMFSFGWLLAIACASSDYLYMRVNAAHTTAAKRLASFVCIVALQHSQHYHSSSTTHNVVVIAS
eukprot:15966-Heterococcus_DN1.PRE.1